jgi:hypothetical protein
VSELVPIEQRTVVFYDDELVAVLVELNGRQEFYVPIRPICDFLGLSWAGQRERINRDAVLSSEFRGVRVTRTPEAGGSQVMQSLPLKYLNGWLFGVNASRVKEEVRERLLRYQRECYDVLADAFLGRRTVGRSDSTLAQVREMGLAIAQMAEEQMVFDRRLASTDESVLSLTARVTTLEKRIAPGKPVTEEQASQISQAVKAVAIVQGKQSGRNEFGAVYGELYRKFGITSYKLLPADQFADAMGFLTEWYHRLTGDDIPF